jgi:hypothetical protein
MSNTIIPHGESETIVEQADSSAGSSLVRTPRSEKIADHHLQRRAIVYVRQSTQKQVFENRESTARQYALVDRAVSLGWPRAAVEVIDEDQGVSGSFVEGRTGFQRLLAEISADSVGLILGLEPGLFTMRGRRPGECLFYWDIVPSLWFRQITHDVKLTNCKTCLRVRRIASKDKPDACRRE